MTQVGFDLEIGVEGKRARRTVLQIAAEAAL
jgi:hypothetical protein